MNGIFKRLLNVKGMVVESSRIVDNRADRKSVV
ncbi:Uncharacterised protein [Bifidobacterium breve]|nr:Uncharacterised protein [Bifidobacterium breve]